MAQLFSARAGATMRKRCEAALAALLTVVLCASLLPNTAFAANAADAAGSANAANAANAGNAANATAANAASAANAADAPDAANKSEQAQSIEQQALIGMHTNIANASVELRLYSDTYDGDPIEPSVTVTLDGKRLWKGTDYRVSYRNNVNAGTATAVITGIGNYTGTAKKNFTIRRLALNGTYLSVNDYWLPYTGKAVKPGVSLQKYGKTLKNGRDFTLSYRNNVKAGTATVIATGKGNYTGSVSNTFKIQQPRIKYCTHVQKDGWQGYRYDGKTSGTSGQKKRLEGIRISLVDQPYSLSGKVLYRTHIQTYGWSQGWRHSGLMAGTSGQKKRLEAIQIKLDGDMGERYDVYYRVHAQKFGWMGWAKNGASAGTAGYAYRLEAIQIKLVPKGMPAPGSTKGAFAQKRR